MKELREVTCIIPDDNYDDDYRIDGIGGWTGSEQWTLSIDEAISEMKHTTFWITDPTTKQVTMIIKRTRKNRPFLTTAPDDSQENNLLSLDSCTSR